MERTLNKVEIKGNVGAEPKITNLENGSQVVRFSVATHETFKAKDGQFKEETTWHNIVAWATKNMPDFLTIKKGSFVEITGRLKYSKYKAKSGEDKYVTEIIALRMAIAPSAALATAGFNTATAEPAAASNIELDGAPM
ncbi:MAG: single-stranded DNA-binding protein [Bacteroidales bacterium]|jgi:single-strand DNA-binding protein|nr:single-stranded DNA-binding protein [Bacteroidales bacterium]